VVIVNVPEVDPAGIVIDPGTVALEEFDDTVTTAPPGGA